MIPYRNYIYEYHAKITSGEIIAGKWIKQIYKIIVDALEKQEYFFNAKAANKAIKFIENFCHHSKLYAFTQFFMPRGRIEHLQATDGVPYDIFVKKGLITLSGENYVDYHDVYNWFTMLLEVYGIRPLKIGYDRYSAQYLITDMANYGFHMDDVYQGENLTPVIREFEGIIKDGNFKIADNNLLKTHFLNVALKHNMETRKFRPIKIEQRAHIDGFVSVIDAMTVRQKYWEECGELLKNAA